MAMHSVRSGAAMSKAMALEHEKTLAMLSEARREVVAEFADRISELESAVEAAKKEARPKMPVHRTERSHLVVAPSQELNFLEFSEIPLNVYKKKEPLEATVVSRRRAIGVEAPGDIEHVTLETNGKLPYVEGQSIGVLPPGLDEKGRPYQQRLYSIASTRYGDDGSGTTVSLCVRRALFEDPETHLEDPARKGVCSNFLCDSKTGDTVKITGPIGKAMLLPENDDSSDIIMVATGTGVAPMRAFIRRLFLERNPAAAAYDGRAWLFLGVPTTSSLLYPEEFDVAETNSNGHFQAIYAISREQPNPMTNDGKCYVQHRLQEHADELFQRLNNGAHIYFCGLKGMMPGIEATLQDACQQRDIDFKVWLKNLKTQNRYHVEVY